MQPLLDAASWIEHHREIIALLKSRYGVRHILYSNLPPLHRFQVLPQPLRWYAGLRARQLNRLLLEIAAADPDCELVNIRIPTEAPYFAADRFHPSAKAYALWADQAAVAIEARLQRH